MATGMLCPDCSAQSGRSVELIQGSDHRLQCPNGHRFDDMADLMARNPGRVQRPARVQPPPPTSCVVQFHTSANMKQALDNRFGERLEPTLEAICMQMLDPDAILVGGEEMKKIRGLARREVKSARHLDAFVSEVTRELADTRAENDRLRHLLRLTESTPVPARFAEPPPQSVVAPVTPPLLSSEAVPPPPPLEPVPTLGLEFNHKEGE